MEYFMPIRVRYSEASTNGVVSLHKILDYFQDSSIFHSESLGYHVKSELEIKRGWFLLAWDVEIQRFPALGEYLKVGTEPYKMRGFYGYRRYNLYDEEGQIIAKADSIWLLMDLKKLNPIRVPKDMIDAYIVDVTDDQVKVKRKLPEDGEWIEKDTIKVDRHFLDTNSHVNNTFYALWAEELLPDDFSLKKVKIDYRQSAFEHDTIRIYVSQEEGCFRCKYLNQDDVLLAIVQFSED